jgi:tRNA(His) 5'-end guanylyltransferase
MDIASRMKAYENATNYVIASNVPLIGRIDGKNFSKIVKKLKCDRPFDYGFMDLMEKSALFLAGQVQGCVLVYTQSDEISFVFRNDQSFESEPWFGNRIQKMVSVAVSSVTAIFNRHLKSGDPLAVFDCRIWYMPSIAEVINYCVWRQRDCVKNSISNAAYYEVSSHIDQDTGRPIGRKTIRKMMYHLNQNQRQELLFKETGINWNDYPTKAKRGILIHKKEVKRCESSIVRKKWISEGAFSFVEEGSWGELEKIIKEEI